MAFDQHERHVGSRSGGIREERGKRPALRAYGRIAYASAYSVMEERQAMRHEAAVIRQCQGQDNPRNWQVEAMHPNGMWITADRSMQGKTLQGALNLIKGIEDRYRIMVRCGHGWSKLRI